MREIQTEKGGGTKKIEEAKKGVAGGGGLREGGCDCGLGLGFMGLCPMGSSACPL